MKIRAWIGLGAAALLLAAPMAVLFSGPVAADEEAQGRIIEISPDNGARDQESEEEQATEQPAEEAAEPQYWIGLQSRPLDSRVLRTHLQLADDVGLVVENVVPGSPAEKAGLRQDDVLVAVNGEPISDVAALQKVVAESQDKPIEFKLFRLAKEVTVKVTPAEMPEDVRKAQSERRFQAPFGGQGPMDIESLLKQLQQGGGRMIGPGRAPGVQAFNLDKMPGGLSVTITREGDGPATITVKKGDKTWTVQGDDEEALKQLPEDVRPFVEQLLQQAKPGRPFAPNFNFGELQRILPDQLGRFDFDVEGVDPKALRQRAEAARERTEAASQRMMKRLEEMEQRLRELQQQIDENPPANRTNEAADPSKT